MKKIESFSSKINVIEEPFMHIIEDKFLDDDDFNLLSSRIGSLIDNSRSLYGSNVLYNQSRISIPESIITRESSILSNSELITFFNKYEEKLLIHLAKLAPFKRNLYDEFSFQISKTIKNGTYHIHEDSSEKLLSVVIYLQPKENIGTFLYKKQLSIPFKQVEWKENRYLAFSRLQGLTRHSYKCNDKADRYTIVLNLLTSKRNIATWREPGFRGKIFVIKYFLKKLLLKLKIFRD